MDNITHTLVGLLLAEAAIAFRARREPPSPSFVLAARLTSVAASNLPDLDVLYAGVTAGKLGYLLHHRGHTHTLLVGVLISAAIAAFVALFRSRFSRGELPLLFALAGVGPIVHVLLDYSNNYGVHPFWPFDTRWFYGDSLFIVEPWLWVVLVPSLIFLTKSIVYRGALALILLLGVALAWKVEFVPWGVGLALSVGSLLGITLVRLLSRTRLLMFGFGGGLVVILLFALGSRVARARIPGEPADVVLTPGPGNPLCFSALVVDTFDERYRLRLATVAAFPGLLPVELCRVEGWEPNLRTSSAKDQNTPGTLRWLVEWSAPGAELQRLASHDCAVAAFLRFARAPYWFGLGEERLHVGDLRYDRSPKPGFAELSLPSHPRECPRNVPPWRPPREDLISGQTQWIPSSSISNTSVPAGAPGREGVSP